MYGSHTYELLDRPGGLSIGNRLRVPFKYSPTIIATILFSFVFSLEAVERCLRRITCFFISMYRLYIAVGNFYCFDSVGTVITILYLVIVLLVS